MKFQRPMRAAALLLALTLTLSPAAGAISVEQAREILREYYIDEIPEEILALPTIDEITNALGDPYTYYMTAQQFEDFQKNLGDSDVVGIGVMVESTADGLKVTSVAPDSPASQAGLKIGDLIVAADGVTVEEAGSTEALATLIRGEAGTRVTITVERDGARTELDMTRAEVVFPTVTGEVVDGHIGWLECTSFGENSGSYFQTYITEEDEQADRWVVDLRGNPGGEATSVVEAVGHVLGNRTVAYLVDREGSMSSWTPNPFPVETPGLIEEPLVVLVDANSASASELFAASMRDYDYALIIGTRTFGKGIAQSVLGLDDGSVMRVTTHRYYSPNYVTPDRSGVLPDLVVDADLADEVARLLCGEAAAESPDVLVLELAGQEWYVHKEAALSADYAPAFAELLSALAPGTPMTLDGESVDPETVSADWETEYVSRWMEDVEDSPYAEEINALAALGAVQGDENGSFLPEEPLTRAELVSLITQAMGYWCWTNQGRAPFTDVSEESWDATAVDITYHLGLVQGNENGEFDPDARIDHQQFITILARMGRRADLKVGWRLDSVTDEELAAPDVQKFASWAREAAVAADSLGLLADDLADIDPNAPTTREEAAAMVYRLMSYSGILTPAAGA